MADQKSSYEDLQEDIRNLKTPEIEVWENKYPEREYNVYLNFPEFTCICPKTSLPDFAEINIEYSPNKHCVELKSYKLYCCSFRDVGIFHEHLVNRLLDDFVQACQPRWAKFEVIMNARGGITTRVTAEWKG